MPSNAMKLSQMIACLETLREQHGDLDCVLALSGAGAVVAIDGRNINVARELPWQVLPQPCAVFGLWQDAQGRLNLAPGQAYQASAEGGEWSYQRDLAPAGKPLVVWKRYGGRDRGVVDEQRRWFVMEGGEKPIRIVDEGVLAWKEAP